jgi:SAM-dependent methyltransferase
MISSASFAHGAGPGVIAPDGCAVDLYAQLPAGREPALIHAAVPGGASILDLGCGAGRIAHPLVDLGHRVVAVDESADMLARVRVAQTRHARIESLDLHEHFDVVLLASHLVNVPDDHVLLSFLTTCARHVNSDGCVLIERHPVSWFDDVVPYEKQVDDVTYLLYDVARPGPDIISATVEYRISECRWTHSFTTRRLDDARLATALAAVGLEVDAVLTDDGSWLRLKPAAELLSVNEPFGPGR